MNKEEMEERIKRLTEQIDFLQDWVQEHKHNFKGEAYCKMAKEVWDW